MYGQKTGRWQLNQWPLSGKHTVDWKWSFEFLTLRFRLWCDYVFVQKPCLLPLVSKKVCDLAKDQQNLMENTNFHCSVDSSLRAGVCTGYFGYKTITSQVKNFFCFIEVMFHSRDIQVIFLTISWFTKSMKSWWVLGHETVNFWIYLLNHNLLTHQAWSTDKYKQGQHFSEIFLTICRTGVRFRSFWI